MHNTWPDICSATRCLPGKTRPRHWWQCSVFPSLVGYGCSASCRCMHEPDGPDAYALLCLAGSRPGSQQCSSSESRPRLWALGCHLFKRLLKNLFIWDTAGKATLFRDPSLQLDLECPRDLTHLPTVIVPYYLFRFVLFSPTSWCIRDCNRTFYLSRCVMTCFFFVWTRSPVSRVGKWIIEPGNVVLI